MANPDVSIVITSYNVASYIARAAASALAQEGVTLEVIFVDDSSTDGTWETIQTLTDPRIKTLRLNANAGPSGARNAGFALANGRWIAVLDGDDAFLQGRLARLLKQEKDADILLDNLEIVTEADGSRKPMFDTAFLTTRSPLSLSDFIDANHLFQRRHGLGYTKPLWRAEFLKAHALRYDEEIRIGEDYILLAEALACGARALIAPECGYAYTVRKGSISHRLTLEGIARMESADARLFSRRPLPQIAKAAQKRRQSSLDTGAAFLRLIDALKARNPIAALAIALKNPCALWLLHMPIGARLRRLTGRAA